MSAPSLFDICIKAVCLHAHSDLLSIEEEDFPTEVRNNLLSFVLTRGLLTPRVCKQFMKDYFTVFTLGMSPLANDEVIGIVGASCPNLVKLEVSSPSLTDEGAIAIINSCRNLETLKLSECFQLSDAMFLELDGLITDTEEAPLAKLTSLDVSGNKLLTNTSLDIISQRCTSLKALGASACDISITGLKPLFAACTMLEKLSVEHCRKVDSQVLIALAEHCTNLTALVVTGCYLVKDEGICAVASACTNLQVLSIKECNQLKDGAINALASTPNLKLLDIGWCGVRASLQELSEGPVGQSLETLSVSWASLLTEDTLQNSLINFANLRTLDLSWRRITDVTLGIVVQQCTNLTALDISGCSEVSEGFHHFACRPTHAFTNLNFAWCSGLTDDAAAVIFKSCPDLASLDISLCTQLTNPVLDDLKFCTSLRRLIISRCSQFTDEAFTFHSACTKLVVLSAADVQISDFKVAELTHRWRDLRVLVLAGCRQLTELAVESIAKHSEVLGNLSLSGCVLVQDEAVKLLGNKIGKTLMWLNLAGTGISDDSIILLSKACPSLQSLNISFCEELTDDSLYAIANNCQGLISFDASTLPKVTELAFCAVVRKCGVLTKLNVSVNENVGENVILEAIAHGRFLDLIDVSRCELVSEEMLRHLKAARKSINIRSSYFIDFDQ